MRNPSSPLSVLLGAALIAAPSLALAEDEAPPADDDGQEEAPSSEDAARAAAAKAKAGGSSADRAGEAADAKARAAAQKSGEAEAPPAPEPAPQAAPAPVAEPAPAAAPSPAPAEKPVQKTLFAVGPDSRFEIKFGGKYVAWVLNQHGFLLGQDVPLDDADYVVQMLRMSLQAGTPHMGVIARVDAAQGWWGADNSPDVVSVASTDANGALVNSASYNTFKMFGDKDTNYAVHFDHAYGYIEPNLPFKLRFQIGRQYFKAGHKLVLDEDYDGLLLTIRPVPWLGFDGMFAVISEGVGSYQAPKGLLMSDKGPWADALIAGGAFDIAAGPLTIGAFGFHYWDKSDEQNSSFLPQGWGYAVARFQPNKSNLTAVGVTVDGTLPVLAGLSIEAEGDVLVGVDKVSNNVHAAGVLDINNGNLFGWNVYLKIDQAIAAGPVGLKPGLTFGLGSGDDDKTSGRGNVNKIQTMGFFPLTNVWEDSVMPDIAGISPQGLGSPVSRGYREFENTLALQGRLAVAPWAPLDFQFSYTFLRALHAINGFDAAGNPTADSSNDIGHEVDINATVKILPKVTYAALFGVFLPGEGAAYLINGNTDSRETVWEMKQSIVIGF